MLWEYRYMGLTVGFHVRVTIMISVRAQVRVVYSQCEARVN